MLKNESCLLEVFIMRLCNRTLSVYVTEFPDEFQNCRKMCEIVWSNKRGDEMRSGYVRCVPFILAGVPAYTMFIEI